MRRFALTNFQITTTADSKLSYTPCYRYVKFTDMILIPIFIDRNRDFPQITKLTKLEKIWVWMVVIFIILFVVTAILTFWNLSWWYPISIFIGANIMNMVMLILCCRQ
jgi:polyferredoxin